MTEEKQYLEAVENTKINQPKTTIQSEIDTVDFRQLIIHAYKSIGVIAEFDKQGRVIEDGRLTGTFQGKNGDRRYLASTSHDPKVGNQITAVTCIKKCSNKEAAEWIKKEFNLKEKVLKKQVDTILKKDEEVNNNTGEITEKEIKPFTWGTPKLDKTLWALKRYEYCLLAGLYNSGKTAYVFDLARKNAQLGHKVMYFILEMSKKELHERIALEKAGVCVEDDRFERMSDEQMKIYTESLNYLNSIKNLEIVEIPRMVKGDIFIIMEAIKRRNPDLVIIDNLGKIAKSSANISDYESETEISDQILKFTNEERIPIILVHHLNAKKTFHGSKKADMMQLRGSGKLADDADLALFVERDIEEDISDEQKAEFIIKVKKNRRKGTFTVAQVYFKDGSFYDEYEPTQEHLNPEWWTK
jgi:replicative DNA helicase